jgi:hypothetical protein
VLILVVGGYKVFKAAGPTPEAAINTQWAQVDDRLNNLEQRLEQVERAPRLAREASKAAVAEAVAPAAVTSPVPARHHLSFSRPVAASLPSAPANPPVTSVPTGNSPSAADAQRLSDATDQQQWQATADRLGNVVGELDAQRDAIERDQVRLNELAGRFARDSQAFTLEKGAPRQQVGPVWLRLETTDPKNQRYTMRLSVDDQTIELKDRALHEAIQFYAEGGKSSFELVISQIAKDAVAGRLVLPQTTASR